MGELQHVKEMGELQHVKGTGLSRICDPWRFKSFHGLDGEGRGTLDLSVASLQIPASIF